MDDIPTLVLDLDGTLVDSLPDIRAALNRLMTGRGYAPFSVAEVAGLVGNGSRRLVDCAFAARGAAADPAAIAGFLEDYAAHPAVASRPYPGVRDTLARLRQAGWRFAVCTNKSGRSAQALLAALDLAPFFAAVGAGDSFPTHKPDPAHLVATLAAAGGCCARAVMVGDHANDIAAARGAGVPAIFARWGYGDRTMAEGAAAIADHFAELAELAPRLLGAEP